MIHWLPMPGLLWGAYPQRRPPRQHLAQRCNAALRWALDLALDSLHGMQSRTDAAWLAGLRADMQALRTPPLASSAAVLRSTFLREGLAPATLRRALALAGLAAERELGLTPFDSQLLAARTVLDNRLAEMATGEGKTLAVALAAATAALAGMPVHVITANDYLVARDAAALAPLYQALGLTVGCVVQPDEPATRAQAYACHITYVTAKELVFDYLRDGLAQAGDASRRATTLLRGLCMAIVDEADAILIDEACVPLVLSAPSPQAEPTEHAQQSLQLAGRLHEGWHFKLSADALDARLSTAGQQWLEEEAHTLPRLWRNRVQREHAVSMALVALHLLQRQRHYVVQEGKVQIIDAATGRVAAGRAWSQGLQQLVELKEGCATTPGLVTLAQISYQRFFPRYHRLGGLSGTLIEARSELLHTYGLSVRRIALRKPVCRSVLPERLFASHADMWPAVAHRVAELHAQGRPVLVATDSIAQTEAAARALAALGLRLRMLHAADDTQEADTVAQAGQHGAITVTTNMAGRGTDIVLGPGVAEAGGLHLICCQHNASARIDRQLVGRAARQGDPGSVQTWLSLDSHLLAPSLPPAARALLAKTTARWPAWAVRALRRAPQRQREAADALQRKRLGAQDERLARQLAFCGAAV